MGMIRNSEDLENRLQELLGHGEELIETGWGTVGAKNVMVGVTKSRLLLEYVTIGMKTKRLDEIPLSMIDAIESRKGDSTIPGWARINIHNAIMDALTTSLIVRKTGERSIHITFRPLPRFKGNREAALRGLKAAVVTGLLFGIPFAFAGGIFALFWPYLKRIVTGRG